MVKDYSETMSLLRVLQAQIYDENPSHVACVCLQFKNW